MKVSAEQLNQAVKQQQETAKAEAAKKKAAVKSAGALAKLAVSFSVGGDLSYTDIHKPGEGKTILGAGLQYSISKRLDIRTGFYVADKIYSAGPYQYHPAEAVPYYSNLEKIDANCTVYEIPVGLKYNFSEKKNHSFFAAAGLASVIMKKEDYNYTYKTATGSYYYRSKTLNNEYKHLLSTISLSAGIQYHPNNWLSVSAEPYLKLPISGIGYGKVKLNSTGLLFSVAVKPFAKKKN
jgi:hypothetical protein